jgi:hypothetical protein
VRADRETLEAWASPGLVAFAEAMAARGVRAEPLAPERVRVGEVEVRLLPGGPAAARCSCWALAPCWHVVLALLDPSGPPAEVVAPEVVAPEAQAELRALGQGAVEAWAGASVAHEAWTLLVAGLEVELDVQPGRIWGQARELGVEARYLAGAGLAGMLSSTTGRAHLRACALVALAWLRAEGEATPPEALHRISLAGSTGAPKAPQAVVEASQAILRELVMVGLSHLSDASAERLFTASVSAHAAKLVRLGKALFALHEDVGRLLDRHAQADEGRLFARLARTYALAEALRRAGDAAPEHLVGRARAKYVEVPPLVVWGLGARRLRTESGLEGVAACLWEPARGRWLSVADVRPVDTPGFEPAARFRAGEVWGGASFANLSRSALRLSGARVSLEGRLSATLNTEAEVTGAPPWAALSALVQEDFQKVAEQARAAHPAGLAPPPPQGAWALLRPARVAAARFDETRQVAWRALEDQSGAQVWLRLRYGEESAAMISALEAWRPTPGEAVVVELEAPSSRITAVPVAFLGPAPDGGPGAVVRCPWFEARPRRGAPAPSAAAPPEPPQASLLEGWRERLEAMAERGLAGGATPAGRPELEPLVQAGLHTLAAAARRAVERPTPEALLAARYVLDLALKA